LSRPPRGIWTRPLCAQQADSHLTNLALRQGARVTNLPLSPVMAFIDTPDTRIAAEIDQIDLALKLASGHV
jgi:hypothetical protein